MLKNLDDSVGCKKDKNQNHREIKIPVCATFQVHAARLQSLKLDTKPSMEDATSEKAEEVIKVADKVLSEVGSVNDILAFFAVKNNDLRPTQVLFRSQSMYCI